MANDRKFPIHRRPLGAVVALLLFAGCGDSTSPPAPEPSTPPVSYRLSVVQGEGDGQHTEGQIVAISANPAPEHYYFSHWSSNAGGLFDNARADSTTFQMPASDVTITANFLPGAIRGQVWSSAVSPARRWNEVLLHAIRGDYARPTVHARNLFHISAAMYDAWAAYDDIATPWLLGTEECPFDAEAFAVPGSADEIAAAREQAVSFAAHRLIEHRFRDSPASARIARDSFVLMDALGFDASDRSTAGGSSALGNHIGACYIAFGFADGANEANDYVNRAYLPVNPPLLPDQPGNPTIVDLNRWQPLQLPQFIDQAGNPVEGVPEFLSPEWGSVRPFALDADAAIRHQRDGMEWLLHHDPGPPPTIDGGLSKTYRWGHTLVAVWSSHLSPADGVMMDISPASIGNVEAYPATFEDYPAFFDLLDGGDPGKGREVNPVTGAAYEPQLVPRGDYTRVLAEFWADGPDSETPPGHWFVIFNEVADNPLLSHRFGGAGTVLSRLEWDVKSYFALGGAMHDAAIAAWSVKGWYDYIRPISSIRAMADRGQGSDPTLPSYDIDGIALVPGFVELIAAGDPLAGEDGEHLGKVKLLAWRGPDFIENAETDAAGVGWILAENWWPYQRPTFVTPPFAGYVSGHSTYSRAAAEVLTRLTGDRFFPGGMSGFEIKAGEFLVFEEGPSVDMTLQWATYQDAADQCSLSRIWGGIHPPVDDIPGRIIGIRVGNDAFDLAEAYFRGRR